jgi:formylmethanofuran dehydrogenase subunit B
MPQLIMLCSLFLANSYIHLIRADPARTPVTKIAETRIAVLAAAVVVGVEVDGTRIGAAPAVAVDREIVSGGTTRGDLQMLIRTRML